MTGDWDRIDAELAERIRGIDGLSLDHERIERFAADIAARRLGPDSNRITGVLETVGSDVIDRIEDLDEAESARYAELGRDALARGEIAAAVLNGGMATRFGGLVKGTVEAFGGRSFLEIKLRQALSQGPVPFLIMNSFATQLPTLAFLKKRGLSEAVLPFLQAISLRLTPEGKIFRDAAGAISPYAPGHGDFLEAIRNSGRLEELLARNVRAILLSNVDNLGAELDPTVIGYHLAHGRPLTVELAETKGGDVGGTVVRVDGRVQVVEGFRFPTDFDQGAVGVINTNTFVISTEALIRDYPLSWFYVEKQVDDKRAVQMERLVGELSAFLSGAYLASARDGSRGRFFPVKTPADLEAMRQDPILRERFGTG
jgi:UTP--glucose-1-phosphate uridylyltransferase